MRENLGHLESEYGARQPSQDLADALVARVSGRKIEDVFDKGLHEFLEDTIQDIAGLAGRIETDFRFYT